MTCDVYVVYQHMKLPYAAGLAKLNAFTARAFPGRAVHFVAVDNLIERPFEHAVHEHLDLVSGDNRLREFSGYNRGLSWLEAAHHPPNDRVLVIANESLHGNYGGDGFLDLIQQHDVDLALSQNGIFGHIDAYPRDVTLLNLRFRRWVRSSFMIMRWRVIRRLFPLGAPIADVDLFSEQHTEFFRPTCPLSDNYRQYLRQWLFEETPAGSEYEAEWHSKTALTAENSSELATKVKCILAEHHFSAMAQALHIPLCPCG